MPADKPHSTNTRQKAIHDVTLYGMLMDLILSALKIVTGFFVHSTALIADGIHSFSDMLTDILVLIVNKYSHDDPDTEHPYGHARFETAGTLLLGVVLFCLGISMLFEYSQQIFENDISTLPSKFALAVVVISLIGKEWQFRFTMAVAKKINSSMLEANAWHSRTDSISSLVVLIGLIATMFGFPIVEIIAAIFVSILIANMGYKMAWEAMQELMDKGLPETQQELILQTLNEVPGIISVHQLRTRKMSNQIFLDAHIQVPSRISVSEGHQINEYAMSRLKAAEPEIRDMTLHIDYEEDDEIEYWTLAPQRKEIENALADSGVVGYDSLQIHYVDQAVSLIIYCNSTPEESFILACTEAKNKFKWLTEIQIMQTFAVIN